MAVDMFLKMLPIKGESKDKAHGGEIDVLAWSWGASQSGTTHTGSGSGAGKVAVQDMSFTHYIDAASPHLMLACCNGKHFAEATLTVRKAGEHPLEYLKIKMTDVMISSVSMGGSGGEDRLTENISLNFGKFEKTYTEQTAQGGAGTSTPAKWDIAANAEQ